MKTFSLKTALRVALLGLTLGAGLATKVFAFSSSWSTTNSGEEGYYSCHGGYVWVWNDEMHQWDYVWCWDCECDWVHEYFWYERTIQITGTNSTDDYGVTVNFSNSSKLVFILHGNGGSVYQSIYYTSNDPYPTSFSVIESGGDANASYTRNNATGVSYSTSLATNYTQSQIPSVVQAETGVTLNDLEFEQIKKYGCIAVARVMMGAVINGKKVYPPGQFPEWHTDVMGTAIIAKAYKSMSDLETYGACSGSPSRQVIVVKDGDWVGSEPTPDPTTHQIPLNSVTGLSSDPTHAFNYLTRVKNGTGSWGKWIAVNHGGSTTSNPQIMHVFDTLPATSWPARIYIMVCIP